MAGKGTPAKPEPGGKKAVRSRGVTAASRTVCASQSAAVRFQRGEAPPPAISLASGEALQMSGAEREQWCSDAGGQSAARRGPESDQLRLLGTTVLNLSIRNGKAKAETVRRAARQLC